MGISLRKLADLANAAEVAKERSKNTKLLAQGRAMLHLDFPWEGRYKDDEEMPRDEETSGDKEDEMMEGTKGSKNGEWTEWFAKVYANTWSGPGGNYSQALSSHSFNWKHLATLFTYIPPMLWF